MTGKELTIRGLKARGFVEDTQSNMRSHEVYRRRPDDGVYLVGRSGGLRVCRGRVGLASSLSLTGQKAHEALQYVGNSGFQFESQEQAEEIYHTKLRLLRGPAAVPA